MADLQCSEVIRGKTILNVALMHTITIINEKRVLGEGKWAWLSGSAGAHGGAVPGVRASLAGRTTERKPRCQTIKRFRGRGNISSECQVVV